MSADDRPSRRLRPARPTHGKKTRLCKNYLTGTCRQNYYHCNFAHGPADYYHTVPRCTDPDECGGDLCHYSHKREPKTYLCLHYTERTCYKKKCTYAHGPCDYSDKVPLCTDPDCRNYSCNGRHTPKSLICKFFYRSACCDEEECKYAHNSMDYAETVPLCDESINHECRGMRCHYRHKDIYSADIWDLSVCPYAPSFEEIYLTRISLRNNPMTKYPLSMLIRLIAIRHNFLLPVPIADIIATYVFTYENFDNYFKNFVLTRQDRKQEGPRYLLKYRTYSKSHGILRWMTVAELLSLYEDNSNFNGMYFICKDNKEVYEHHSKLLWTQL